MPPPRLTLPANVQSLTSADQAKLAETLTCVLGCLVAGSGVLDARLRERFAEAAALLAG